MASAKTDTDKPAAGKAAAARTSSARGGTKAAAKPTDSKANGTKSPAKKPSGTRAAPKRPATTKAASARSGAAKPKTEPARVTEARTENAASANRQSRDSSMTGKEHDDHVARAWTLADRIGIAMFVTWDGERQRARPLAASIEKDEGAIYFLTDIAGEKDEQISEFPYVSVNFADNRKARYVVFSGKATLSNDRKRIKDLWSPFAKAWWDSPDDPNIRVIRMVPEDAELWDSPGRLVSTFSMLTAAIRGKAPKMGENAKVVL